MRGVLDGLRRPSGEVKQVVAYYLWHYASLFDDI